MMHTLLNTLPNTTPIINSTPFPDSRTLLITTLPNPAHPQTHPHVPTNTPSRTHKHTLTHPQTHPHASTNAPSCTCCCPDWGWCRQSRVHSGLRGMGQCWSIRFFSKALVGEHSVVWHGHDLDRLHLAAQTFRSYARCIHAHLDLFHHTNILEHALSHESRCPCSRSVICSVCPVRKS